VSTKLNGGLVLTALVTGSEEINWGSLLTWNNKMTTFQLKHIDVLKLGVYKIETG